jgi:O-acetyl-ADP-ribose deacetylase (regulator of RNase III)
MGNAAGAGKFALEVVRGDIARQPGVEAIVNAANAELMPGGGVAGAIHRAAGPGLAEACRLLAPIAPGAAVLTGGYGLPNRGVIHCLGPVYGRDKPAAELLAACYRNALQLAGAQGIHSIAFPAISAGVFGYPLAEAARVSLEAVRSEAPRQRALHRVRFVLFDEEARAVFERALHA